MSQQDGFAEPVVSVMPPDEATLLKGLVARGASRELLRLQPRPLGLPARLEAAHEVLRAITVQLVPQAEGVLLKLTAPALDQPALSGPVSPVPLGAEHARHRLGEHD